MKTQLGKYLTDPDKLAVKIILFFLFLVFFTGTDLIVKQLAFKNLRNNPDVVIIPNGWHFHYETNDDIGFSIIQ